MTTFLDVEFVVVETETIAAPLTHRPIERRALPPARRHTATGDDRLTVGQARKILAELLGHPLAEVHIVDAVGRVCLLEYEPLGKADPDIMLCAWSSAKPINRAICEMQRARGVNWPNWGEYWQGLTWHIEYITAVMIGSTITGPERRFILDWAYGIRDAGRRIVPTPQVSESHRLWWGL